MLHDQRAAPTLRRVVSQTYPPRRFALMRRLRGRHRRQEIPDRRPGASLDHLYLKNVQDEVVVFQLNENDSKAGGGPCFGDSGGAVFVEGFVLGDAFLGVLADLQRDRRLPAGRHAVLSGLP